MRSPGTQRQRERVVEFEDAPNREGGMEERNSEGGRPLEFGAEGNKIQGTNLSPLLVAYLGRNENGQPLQSSLTSVYGGHQPSTNNGNPSFGGTFAQYPQGGTAILCNDILMFQQVNNIKKNLFLKHGLVSRTYSKKSLIMASTFGSKSKSFMTMSLPSQDKPLTNGRWDFAEPVKAISLPQDVPSTSDRRLIELENQVQHLMEAHIAPMQLTQVNKITSSCEICSGPHDTQYCMQNPKQAFVEYVSSCTNEAGGKWYTFKPEQNNFCDTYNPSWKSHPNLSSILNRFFNNKPQNFNPSNLEGLVSNFMASQDARLSKFESDFKQQQSEMTNKIDTVLKAITDRMAGALPSDTVKNPKLNNNPTPPVSDDGDVMFIEIVKKNDDSRKEEPKARGLEVEYFDIFLTQSELAYHNYLMCGSNPSIFLRNLIITEGCPSNLKIPCNIGHVHVERAYIDLNSPLNIMTRMMYNWIMRRKLDPRENSDRGVSNFTGRIKGMHVFVGNFTYVIDFMIVEDISSMIDPRLSQVVLGNPFVEVSNLTHDPPEGVVRFMNGTNKIAYKMPHMIEQYNSLSDLEKEHTKLVYLRNEEDRRRGVGYVMSKIIGFYKECLDLGPEYVTGMDDEGEVTLYLMRRSLEVLRKFHWVILGGRFNQLSHVSSPLLSKPGEY
ncbi:hypothetical protein Tco_0955914 [Tanacetum coccineum]|uniref:MAK10-like protein n=1 Tax=Tanacetum coccineum TaxID=301880 RepID=A0ABQ5E8L6_9ASTR